MEKHDLTAAILEAINGLLSEKRLLLKSGTIVEATIIAAPSSTKSAAKARDPEMKQAMKGKAWYFGMKLHVGTDCKGRVAPAGYISRAETALHSARNVDNSAQSTPAAR